MIENFFKNFSGSFGRINYLLLFGVFSLFFFQIPLHADSERVTDGLEVLYRFGEGKGVVVRDDSGHGKPLNLRIRKSSSVVWKEGGLLVRSGATISSPGPADQLIQAIKKSNALTVEAWVKPGNLRQKGPARIVSLSNGPSQRNFTLGQDGNKFDFRLRTSKTDKNGLPSTSTKNRTVRRSMTHIVCTRDASGNVKIYIDGKIQGSKKVSGDFSNWDNQFSLNIANEFSGDRPWMGSLSLVAIYSKPLVPEQVLQNFHAGPGKGAPLPKMAVKQPKDPKAIFFETHIAPILARNCIECHDSFMKKGELDLSRKSLALSGGESGKVIVPGKSSESHLWELVESDEMPTKGDPLTSEEKSLIKKWIDDGAHWSLETIDPVLYLHQNQKETVWIRRLTIPEYIETVEATVAVDITKEAHEYLPADLRADGFSNTAYNLGIDLKHVESYSRLASIIVERMDVLKFASRFSKSRKLSTDDTMRQFVGKMGKWILRGPLDDREVSLYSGIATTVAAAGGNYRDAVSLMIEAMLQSPRFIYRIENQKGSDPLQPAGDYELASRISYIIWGAPPDDQLYQAAERGDLQENELLQEQINRMHQDPRAVKQSLRFLSEWLNLDRLDHMNPDPGKFPEWSDQLANDMREETLAYFEDVVWKQNKPLSALFDTQTTFATPELAKHYGLEPKGSGLHEYDLSAVPSRGGLLTQGSVLTMGGDDASMVTRGLFVLHDVLRGTVKDPPPGLDITPVPSKPGISQRKISEERIANVSCGGCHSRFEPLAFGLEKFDGIGKFHEKDEFGNQLREDGEILFPGESKPVTYQNTQELMTLLAKSERVQKTLTWKLTQFALGRPLDASDAESINSIHESAMKNGGTWSSLISAIIKSDLVQLSQMESIQETKK